MNKKQNPVDAGEQKEKEFRLLVYTSTEKNLTEKEIVVAISNAIRSLDRDCCTIISNRVNQAQPNKADEGKGAMQELIEWLEIHKQTIGGTSAFIIDKAKKLLEKQAYKQQ